MKAIFFTHAFLVFLLLPELTWAQYVTVSGYIKDSSNGKALENVSIFDSCSKIGTITNHDGFYRLVLHEKKADLIYSFNGFKDCNHIVLLSSDTILPISMQPANIQQKQQRKPEFLRADSNTVKKQDDKHNQNN